MAVTLAIPFMVAFDFPVKRPWLFQFSFIFAVWYCAFADVIEVKQCGFYSNHPQCHGKVRSTISSALPTRSLIMYR